MKVKKSLVFFIPDLTMGGTLSLIKTLIPILKKHYNISIVVQEIKGQLSLDVPIYSLNTKNTILSVIKLNSYLKSEKIDIILSFMERANLISYVACKMTQIYCVLSIHNSPKYAFCKRTFLKRLMGRLLYKMIDKKTPIISVSKGISKELKNDYKLTNIHTIYNLIDCKKYVQNTSTLKTIQLLSYGRFVDQKRMYLLIEVAKFLKEKKVDFKMTLIGDGLKKDSLLDLVRKYQLTSVVFLLGEDSLSQSQKDAHIYMQCSEFEGFGIAMLEAMACGLAIIAVDCPYGPKEILLDNCGILIEDNSDKQIVEDMSLKVVNLIDDSTYLQNLSKKSLERSKDFDIDKISGQYIDVFEAF
ncbi:MAG: hypothetical protein COB02_10620 [Candidatus Cloacimonadota bacterium]|nr:MAG: hypothetical protein COB02_10620 [Candidatus Cloacimonadota bacterium]